MFPRVWPKTGSTSTSFLRSTSLCRWPNGIFFLKPTQLLVELLEVTKLQKISSPSLSFFEHAPFFAPFEALQQKNAGSCPPMLRRHFCTVFCREHEKIHVHLNDLQETQHKPSHFLLAELVHSDLKFAEFTLPKSSTASLPWKRMVFKMILSLLVVEPTHLKNMLVKLHHFPKHSGWTLENIWVATTYTFLLRASGPQFSRGFCCQTSRGGVPLPKVPQQIEVLDFDRRSLFEGRTTTNPWTGPSNPLYRCLPKRKPFCRTVLFFSIKLKNELVVFPHPIQQYVYFKSIRIMKHPRILRLKIQPTKIFETHIRSKSHQGFANGKFFGIFKGRCLYQVCVLILCVCISVVWGEISHGQVVEPGGL